MKTHRKSRSTENRNARKEMTARGGGRTALASMLPPPCPPIDRRFRRVARRRRIDTTKLDIIVLGQDGMFTRPSITVVMDDHTRRILDGRMG